MIRTTVFTMNEIYEKMRKELKKMRRKAKCEWIKKLEKGKEKFPNLSDEFDKAIENVEKNW